MSSLTDQSSKSLAFKLVMQLTDLADGATFTKRMAVLMDIKEAWEKNTEVSVITEDDSFGNILQASLDPAEGEPGPQLGPNSNLGSIAEEPDKPSYKESLFEDLGNNRAQATLTGMSFTGSLQAEQDWSPGGDTSLDAFQDFSPYQRPIDEEDASADGRECTGDIPTLQGGGKTSGASNTIKAPTNLNKAMATLERPFACHLCSSRFKRGSHLKQHIKRHIGDKQYPCAVCNKTFYTTSGRNAHAKSHVKPNFTSDKKEIKSQKRSSHQRNTARASHLKAPKRRQMAASTGIQKKYEHFRVNKKVTEGYQCSICPRVCFTLKGIEKHTENHSKIQPQPEREKKVIKKSFQCESCLKHFASSTSLKRHIVEVCSKSAFKKQPALNPHRIRKVNKKMPTLTGRSQVTSLTSIKKNVPKGKPANKEKVHVPQKVKVLKCRFCEKTMAGKVHWEEHERIHTGEKPFGCLICDVWFRRISVRNKHMKDMHPGMIHELEEKKNITVTAQKEKKPSEHLGLKAQASKASLTRKVTPATQGSNTSSMQASKKALFAKKSLSPGASTSQSEIAVAANHHSPTGTSVRSPSKQASQQKAPSTSYLSSPTSHRGQKAEVHKNLIPHQCQMCSKVFASAAKLAFHEKSHVKHSSKSQDTPSVPETSGDQEKLYNCVFCDEVFSCLDEFMEHQRQLHTGNKPFSCKCGKAFTIKNNLIKHKSQYCVVKEETGPTPK